MRARLQLLRLFQTAHSGEKQKTQQAIREIFRNGTVAFASAKPQTHWEQMQRQVMKDRQNPEICEIRD
jgi:hypothetical protein